MAGIMQAGQEAWSWLVRQVMIAEAARGDAVKLPAARLHRCRRGASTPSPIAAVSDDQDDRPLRSSGHGLMSPQPTHSRGVVAVALNPQMHGTVYFEVGWGMRYSITSSARVTSDGGMLRPSARAVLRLITSSPARRDTSEKLRCGCGGRETENPRHGGALGE
jgi:hypothetical protein